jgi:hypothetical protein
MRSLLPLLALTFTLPAAAEPFVYRGTLEEHAAPADGEYALQLSLFADAQSGARIAGPVYVDRVRVVDGRLVADVDFGTLPPQLPEAWLEVRVRGAGEIGDYESAGARERVALKAAQLCPAAWALSGNASTDPLVDFLGTTDAQPLLLRANAGRVGFFETIVMNGGSTANVVFGSSANQSGPGSRGASIGGGGATAGSDPDHADVGPNLALAHYATVAGGNKNTAGSAPGAGDFASIGGGRENIAAGDYSVVAGGNRSVALGAAAAVLGGASNHALGELSQIGGGDGNRAIGGHSSIGGGTLNETAGEFATVAGGQSNCAGGRSSWSGGRRAKVRPPAGHASTIPGGCNQVAPSGDADGDEGSFVWADSQNADFLSTGPNQFAIRAAGGLRLSEDTNQFFGSDARQMLNLFDQSYGIGVQSGTLYFRSGQRFAWFDGGVHDDDAIDPGAGGALLMTLGIDSGTPTGTARAQTFTSVSSRAVKTAFEAIDPSDVLARVLALPVSEWSYRNEPARRHIGPMSQDFHAAFGLNGDDDEAIATVDADGVALAAIQGLDAKLEAELAALRAEVAALRALLRERDAPR